MWQENLSATDLQDLTSSSNILAFLESQWAVLEEKIAIITRMKVCKMLPVTYLLQEKKISFWK